uniref:Uncharacterized protein n=1 Tax=Panagrolaimus sp. JU765 TaxID=591449 RepID=A0AC34QF29_9BILA
MTPCRFQRCLKAGMQVESVRIETTEKSKKRANEFTDEQVNKKFCVSPIVEKIKQLELKTQEEADYNENESSMLPGSLNEIFAFPESMDAFRTKIVYRVRLHAVTEEELNFCKFRTLAYATDYIRAISELNLIQMDFMDQIKLLRHSYGPLTIFNMAVGSIKTTRDRSLLCLPTGITISKHESVVTNRLVKG